MNTTTVYFRKRQALTGALLLLIFFGPLLLAWFMVIEGDKPKTNNYGQLIQPPLNLAKLPLYTISQGSFDQAKLRDHWLLLYVQPTSCNATCQKNLYYLRQIRTATGKDMTRIERVLLTFTDQTNDPQLANLLTNVYPGTWHLLSDKNQFQKFIAPIGKPLLALEQGSFYLVDPHGNVMMYYPADAKPSGIFKDLTRLLKVSQIG